MPSLLNRLKDPFGLNGLRAELRRFFIQRKELHRADRDKKIIALLSPMLKMRAVKKQCEWLRCIPYLRTAQLQLIAQIETHEAQAAQAATAPPPPGTPAASPDQPRPTAPPQPPQDEPRPQTPPPPPPPPTS